MKRQVRLNPAGRAACPELRDLTGVIEDQGGGAVFVVWSDGTECWLKASYVAGENVGSRVANHQEEKTRIAARATYE